MSNQNRASVRLLIFTAFLLAFLVVWGQAPVSAQNNPVPLLYQPLTPDKENIGDGNFTLTVDGMGFSSGTVLNWNGSPRITTVVSSKRLRARIEASDIATAGTAAITVSNPAPGGGTSNVVYFPIRSRNGEVSFARVDTPLSLLGAVAVGDFNNDGKPDVAVGQNQGSGGANSILIFLGKGDGTFRKPVNNPTTSHYQPAAFLAADFNGDGGLDLAVSDALGNAAIFLGNGDGTLTQLTPFQTTVNGIFLAAADIDQDGKLDLVTAGSDSGSASADIFLGRGDGTFTHSQTLTASAGVGNPALADVDNDGTMDLVLPDGSSLDIFLGNGDGTFQGPVSDATGFSSTSVAFADINGDGRFDLVTNGLSLLLNQGAGVFQDSQNISVGATSYNIVFGDFNGTNSLSAALLDVQNGAASIDVFHRGENGVFENPGSFASGTAAGRGLGMADFNNDGLLDLVDTSNFGSPALSLFLQTAVRFNKTDLIFGNRQVGSSSKPKVETLTNIGPNVVDISSINISGTNASDFSQTNDCGSQLPPRGSCKIPVVFSPSARGTRSASLNIVYDGLGSPITVPLTGTGVVLQLSLTPSTMTFDTQLVDTQSPAQIATLSNTGTDPATISSISVHGKFVQRNDCPPVLGPGQNCEIRVQFRPTKRGPAIGKVEVSDGMPGGQIVSLSGVGTVLKVSATSIQFGNQQVGTTSPPVRVKLSNKSKKVVNISDIEIDGTNAADFAQTNHCGNKISAGRSCEITVTFTPSAQGSRSASLSISDDGGSSPQKVALSGNGT